MIHPCDGQTDGWAIAYTRYSIYAVARKNPATTILNFKFRMTDRHHSGNHQIWS